MKSSVENQPRNKDTASGLIRPLHNTPLCMRRCLGALHPLWRGFGH